MYKIIYIILIYIHIKIIYIILIYIHIKIIYIILIYKIIYITVSPHSYLLWECYTRDARVKYSKTQDRTGGERSRIPDPNMSLRNGVENPYVINIELVLVQATLHNPDWCGP